MARISDTPVRFQYVFPGLSMADSIFIANLECSYKTFATQKKIKPLNNSTLRAL
jgi:hypothetical protein